MYNLRFFISPFFVNKFYLFRRTQHYTKKYIFKGATLDIGCGVKPYKSLFTSSDSYEGIDFKNFSNNNTFDYEKPDFFFNSEYKKTSKLNFPDNSYDNTVSFQVLEHHPKPETLIKEMYRITKLGGLILISCPFLGGLHEEPNDYQRFTKFGLRRLFEPYHCKVLELESYGSLVSTISMLLNEDLCNFANRNRISYIISILIYPPFLIFQYISLFFDIFLKSKHIVRGYIIIVKKI